MPTALQRRARTALSARMASLLPPDALHADGEHAVDLADALVPTLTAADVAWVHGELARGAKGELRPTRAGAVPAHAAWSSTALVAGAFASWRTDPGALRVAGLGGFTDVRLEERLLIPHGGGTPNLDVALPGPGTFTGVEAKLTEHLAPQPARAWAKAYRRPAMASELRDGWAAVFAALLEGRWTPRFLNAAQLVKHALSLQAAAADGTATQLVLLYWEPTDGDDLPEVVTHREEVAELLDRLGDDGAPRLHARTYAQLLDDWEPLRPQHVAALRQRTEVAAGPAAP
ncbi:hypothetical protein DSM112329_04704 [Paraconexibacter sp. AEG42_29]|uniref:Uncharacterized protein n=1 Tax=Paraconexibacter sp. AEG42_29 TaxID=2997339 RepID=A0AAU7B1L6_9ACTN